MNITTKGQQLAWKLNPYLGTTRQIEVTCSLIARHATTLARIAEEECNGPWFTDLPMSQQFPPAKFEREMKKWNQRLEANQERLEARVADLVADLPHTDNGPIGIEFRGDPRGFVVRLIVPDANGCEPYTKEIGVA